MSCMHLGSKLNPAYIHFRAIATLLLLLPPKKKDTTDKKQSTQMDGKNKNKKK